MSADSETTVLGYLGADHDRLDGLLVDATAHLRAGAMTEAVRALEAFASGLRRHIRLEDEVLFPIFERVTGMERGPTTVMRMEHRTIELHLDQMVAALEKRDAGAFLAEKMAMLAVLGDHNLKEEAIIYPQTDAGLSADEQRRLVAELRGFR